MKITCLCCTYNRPRLLGQMLSCYLEQTYPDRELIILDDGGQYDAQQGDRWRLVSVPDRWPTLGDKRNACFELISPDTDAVAIWDDDDLYLPWHLDLCAAGLADADWSRPSRVLHNDPDWTLRQYQTGGLYHAGMAYTVGLFWRSGGYPPLSGPEDQGLFHRFEQLAPPPRQADPLANPNTLPAYIYRWNDSGSWHISGMGNEGYRALAQPLAKTRLEPIAPPLDLCDPVILPGVNPRPF